MNLNFDARQHKPEQTGNFIRHPIGTKFPAIVSEVVIDGENPRKYHIDILFSTPEGQIKKRYGFDWDSQEKNMQQMTQISKGNLTALCHATGVYILNTGQELINARLMIDIGWQKGQQPTTEKPEGGYTEVSKVYDANGNEPGKATPAPAVQQGGQQGGWPQTQAPSAPPPANNAPAPAAGPTNWQPGPSAAPGSAPPWASGGR